MPLPPPTHNCPFALLKYEDPPAHVAMVPALMPLASESQLPALLPIGLFQPLSLAALPDSSLLMPCLTLKLPLSSYLRVSLVAELSPPVSTTCHPCLWPSLTLPRYLWVLHCNPNRKSWTYYTFGMCSKSNYLASIQLIAKAYIFLKTGDV